MTDPCTATRRRLEASHADLLQADALNSQRLLVEAILGMIGDLADPVAVTAVLRNHPDVRTLPQRRYDALCKRVAAQARTVEVALSFPAKIPAAGPATESGDEESDPLRDRIAEAARSVHLRLGPNALSLAQRGEPLGLSGGEADDIATAVLAVIRPLICGASAEGFASGLLGPCVLHPTHEGPVHQGPGAERWLRREDIPRTGREIVHQSPARGFGVTPCCGLAPFELPRTDRMSTAAADVTCPRRDAKTIGEAGR